MINTISRMPTELLINIFVHCKTNTTVKGIFFFGTDNEPTDNFYWQMHYKLHSIKKIMFTSFNKLASFKNVIANW